MPEWKLQETENQKSKRAAHAPIKNIMKSKFYTSLFGGAVLALILPLTAIGGGAIPGVDVNLGKDPGGIIIARGVTGTKGTVEFSDLKPGNYSANINTTSGNIPKQGFLLSVVFSGNAQPVRVDIKNSKGRPVKILFTVPKGEPQRATVRITGRRGRGDS